MYYLLGPVIPVICIYTVVGGKTAYKQLESAQSSSERIKHLRRWVAESWLLFGIPALIKLLAIGKPDFLQLSQISIKMF